MYKRKSRNIQTKVAMGPFYPNSFYYFEQKQSVDY